MKNSSEISISKYPFLKGTQCKKSFWLHYKKPELKSPLTIEQQMLFDKGKAIGILARQLYPDGIDISKNGTIFSRGLVEPTKEALKSEHQVFYEAGFISLDGSMLCITDIFMRCKKRTCIIEVKSSTEIKTPEHILDVAFQWRVLKESGVDMSKIEMHIAYLNKEYCMFDNNLDFQQLFVVENVTSRAKGAQILIERYLSSLKPILSHAKCPTVNIGAHCSKPYECEFIQHCWKNVPEHSVFTIGRIKKYKAEQLFNKGIVDVSQITEDVELTEPQRIEVGSVKAQKPHINKSEIKKFCDSLNLDKPIMFMDFESMVPAVPKFNGTGCYNQICVQYCVLYRENKNSGLQRREFLANHGSDPRKEFIEKLLRDTSEEGNIIVYNQNFEISRLKELAEFFPEYAEKIRERISRIRDLMTPFAKRHYYHYSMKGSHSIKQVLGCIVPEMEAAYKKLTINNGNIAMNKYESLDKMTFAERQETKIALLEYCHLDVLSMVKILDALQEIVKKD